MCAPNLLQFVPNDYIANNYLVAGESSITASFIGIKE